MFYVVDESSAETERLRKYVVSVGNLFPERASRSWLHSIIHRCRHPRGEHAGDQFSFPLSRSGAGRPTGCPQFDHSLERCTPCCFLDRCSFLRALRRAETPCIRIRNSRAGHTPAESHSIAQRVPAFPRRGALLCTSLARAVSPVSFACVRVRRQGSR